MTVWCCGPECAQLTAQANEAQAAQLRKAQADYDHVVACAIIHPGKDLTNDSDST